MVENDTGAQTLTSKIMHYMETIDEPQTTREINGAIFQKYPDVNRTSVMSMVSMLHRDGSLEKFLNAEGDSVYIHPVKKWDQPTHPLTPINKNVSDGKTPDRCLPFAHNFSPRVSDADIIGALTATGGWMTASEITTKCGVNKTQSGGIAAHLNSIVDEIGLNKRKQVKSPFSWEYKLLSTTQKQAQNEDAVTTESVSPTDNQTRINDTSPAENKSKPPRTSKNLEDRIATLRRMGAELADIQQVCYTALDDMFNKYKQQILTEELKQISSFDALPSEWERINIENRELKEHIHEIENKHMVRRFKEDRRALVGTH